MNTNISPAPIINRREVCGFLNVSDTTLWRMVRAGRFPKPVKISERRIGWPKDQIEAWLEVKRAEAA